LHLRGKRKGYLGRVSFYQAIFRIKFNVHLIHALANLQGDFEKRADRNDPRQQALLDEMRAHVKKV